MAAALLTPDDVELIARVAEELDVVATPSLDCGQVVVDFDGRRVQLAVLREAVDPVGLVRCMLSGAPGDGAEAES